MELLLNESVDEPVKGGILTLLRSRGVTASELAIFATYLRENSLGKAMKLGDCQNKELLDTCGTGGGAPSFNISTAAAFIVAAAGVKVAKHGNRGVTSKFGSADVLETCGVKIQNDPEALIKNLEQVGITFLFAPAHHPTMKNVSTVRKSLGIKTVFNQLGPLANPFGAEVQLLGVYSLDIMAPMAGALALLGTKRAAVVHSHDGLDEVSPCAPTRIFWVEEASVREELIHPRDYGLELLSPVSLAPGKDLAECSALFKEAISEPNSLRCQVCLPSAATALLLSGAVESLNDGAKLARETVASGAAIAKLYALIEISK